MPSYNVKKSKTKRQYPQRCSIHEEDSTSSNMSLTNNTATPRKIETHRIALDQDLQMDRKNQRLSDSRVKYRKSKLSGLPILDTHNQFEDLYNTIVPSQKSNASIYIDMRNQYHRVGKSASVDSLVYTSDEDE
jgi:hypothetical protein